MVPFTSSLQLIEIILDVRKLFLMLIPECKAEHAWLVNKSRMELENTVNFVMGLSRAAANGWLASWGLLLLRSEGFWAFLWLSVLTNEVRSPWPSVLVL